MGIDIKDIGAWGKDAQRQVLEQIKAQKKSTDPDREALRRKLKDDFESQAERDYYAREIWPRLQTGEIVKCFIHSKFVLLEGMEFNGVNYGDIVYTTDFLIAYRNGQVKAVEVKSKKIKKLQRDYHIRRHLFIEKYCRPRGWLFEEYFVK